MTEIDWSNPDAVENLIGIPDIDLDEGFCDAISLSEHRMNSIISGEPIKVSHIESSIAADFNPQGELDFLLSGYTIGKIKFTREGDSVVIDFVLSGNTTLEEGGVNGDLFTDELGDVSKDIETGLNISGLGLYMLETFIEVMKGDNVQQLDSEIYNQKIVHLIGKIKDKGGIKDFRYANNNLQIQL